MLFTVFTKGRTEYNYKHAFGAVLSVLSFSGIFKRCLSARAQGSSLSTGGAVGIEVPEWGAGQQRSPAGRVRAAGWPPAHPRPSETGPAGVRNPGLLHPHMKCENCSHVEAKLFSSHGQLFRTKYSVFIVGRSFDKLMFPCLSLPPYFLLLSV